MKFTAALCFALLIAPGSATRGYASSETERFLQSGKSGKTGKTGKSSGGGGSGSTDPCDLCVNGRPSEITFKYVPANPNGNDFEKHTCSDYFTFPASTNLSVLDKDGNILFGPALVNDGDVFTVTGPFDADSFFQFSNQSGLDNGGSTCIIHTSCSDVLLPGYENRIGPFELQGGACGTSSTPPPSSGTTPPSGDCVICDPNNKVRPDVLNMIYRANGQTSAYQTIDKADCVAGTYPTSTTLTVMDKNGNVHEVISNVVDGMQIQIGNGYDLDAETHFMIEGWAGGSCFIHTSCSQPLVQYDQLGPFEIIAGNNCEPTTSVCIVPDKETYACGEAISVSWDLTVADPSDPNSPYTPLADDWIGIYPCDATTFFHAVVWEWTCGVPPTPANVNAGTCTATATGTLTIDSLPFYNEGGPHEWPVQAGCYKAVILRNDGPSVPPYVSMCESVSFTVTSSTATGCM